MVRYTGQDLPSSPRIAVIANDAIGNWVMATPLLQLLRQELQPGSIHMYCGTRTSELQRSSNLAEEFVELHGSGPSEFLDLMGVRRGEYDLVVNLESTGLSKVAAWVLGVSGAVAGPALGIEGRGDFPFQNDERGRLWQDPMWTANDLSIRYPFISTGFISEIFARLCYLQGKLPLYEIPTAQIDEAIPDILISASASLSEKLWPLSCWASVVSTLQAKGASVGLVGARPSEQQRYWIGATDEQRLIDECGVVDLRGRFTLPQVVGALSKAKCVLTIDNGILHLAVAARVPTVGIYRHGIHRLWAPPYENLTVLTPGESNPVSVIPSNRVIEAVERSMSVGAI